MLTSVLGSRLHRHERRVAEHSSADTQDDLGSDHAGDLAIGTRAEANEDAERGRKQAAADHDKAFEPPHAGHNQTERDACTSEGVNYLDGELDDLPVMTLANE